MKNLEAEVAIFTLKLKRSIIIDYAVDGVKRSRKVTFDGKYVMIDDEYSLSIIKMFKTFLFMYTVCDSISYA